MIRVLPYVVIVALLTGCKIQYKFNDVNIDAQTALINQFAVSAPLAPPSAGQVFMEELQDVVLSQSKLDLVNNGEDISFSGTVVGYTIRPVGIEQNDISAQNRLTITVKVSYVNNLDGKKNFDQSFTRFADFQSSVDITTVQDQLMEEIYEQITQDVFNRAFSNW